MIAFTPRQLEAIGLDHPGRDSCIVAGPGSGKTTVLVERFRGLVASGVSPLRILAITFTEKATNQMRARLGAAFDGEPETAEQIRRAWVSTVHGFCARLLRENAILAGIDPRFRVLNDQEAFAMEQRAAADALDQFLRDDPERVRAMLHAGYAPDLALAMIDVYHAIRAAGTPLASLDSKPPSFETARAALDQLGALCLQFGLPARFHQRAGQPVSLADLTDLAELGKVKLTSFRRANRNYESIKQTLKTTAPAAALLATGEFFAAQRTTLVDALTRFDALYRARKASQAALDFSDLEELSVRLLEEHPKTQARIRGQFDHVLMDEFQDTNGLQSRLVSLVRPPGGFFAVGDINQSIYGFRYSDPEVFRRYRTEIESGGGRLVELRENWRSRKEILDAVTSLLGSAHGIETHEFRPTRKFPRKSATSVEVIRVIGDDALEARWIAARIVELAGAPARFGDVAVLVRKADSIAPIAAALDDAAVPYSVTAAKGFYEAREVADLTHLLRIIANPLDEISFAAVLRSPLAGVSDQDLLRSKLRESPPAVAAFRALLETWRSERHHSSPDRLLIRAMDRAGYELRFTPRERGNVARFLSQVRDMAARLPLDEVVEELARLRESDPREQDAEADHPAGVVRIMTIHAAKGLEFPIVFIPAMQAAGHNRGPALNFSPRLGLGVRWRDPAADGESVKDSLYAAIQAEQKEKDAAETNRLLYVAMTRAEESLVLSCSGKLREWALYLETAWNLALDTPFEGVREERLPFPVRVICTDRPPQPPAQLALSLEPQTAAPVPLPAVTAQYDSTASVTSIALFDDCPRKYYLSRYLGFETAPPPDPAEEQADDAPDEKDLSATDFGRHTHALLAGASREGAIPEALSLVERFESSQLGLEAAGASRVERELDFLLAVEDVVLRGQIDLWFDDCLVDYKTDDVTAAEAHRRSKAYELQLQIYALAIERMAGRLPARAALYYLRPGVAVDVDLSPASIARAGQAVRSFREYQSRGEFPMRVADRCRRCPHYEGMCPARIGETGA